MLLSMACTAGDIVRSNGSAPTTTGPTITELPTPTTNANDGTRNIGADQGDHVVYDGNTYLLGARLGPGANLALVALRAEIEAAAQTTQVPADLIAAVIWTESRAQAGAAGGGLMQISDDAFSSMKSAHPDITGPISDAKSNALASSYYLLSMQATMQTMYARNDWPIVLRAYNSGGNGVDPNNLNAIPKGTGIVDYVTRNLTYWHIIDTAQSALPP